jgi:hypothetical protein
MIDFLLFKHEALDWDLVSTEKKVTFCDYGIHGIPDAVVRLSTPLTQLYVVIEYKNSDIPKERTRQVEQKD